MPGSAPGGRPNRPAQITNLFGVMGLDRDVAAIGRADGVDYLPWRRGDRFGEPATENQGPTDYGGPTASRRQRAKLQSTRARPPA